MSIDENPREDGSWSVFGHEWAVQLLQRSTSSLHPESGGGPRHAYLFLGPRQVGKTTLAREFARSLLCTADHARPCGFCRACQRMAHGAYSDFRLIQPSDPDGNVDRVNGTIRVERASDLIREAALRPVENRYKVFLVQDIHTARDSFANKLLKTLEEPPDHVILCLTALERSGLLATILSRCQIIELRPLPNQIVRKALLTGWQADAERAELLARLSNGRLGWAVEQLAAPDGQSQRQAQLEQLWELIAANRIVRLDFSERLARKRDNQQLFSMLETWTSWWRDVLLAQAGCLNLCSNIDHQAEIARQAEQIQPKAVQEYLHTVSRIESYLHHTVNTRLALDALLLQLPDLCRAGI